MKTLALLASVLAMCCTAFSATYSKASLNGSYSFQIYGPKNAQWSKTFACPTNSNITYTANGSSTTEDGVDGVMSFDGNGNVTGTATQFGRVDYAASANTLSVTWDSSCKVITVNPGSIVYLASTTITLTGKYTVQSTGVGTFSPTGQPDSFNIQLAAQSSNGISNTVLFRSVVRNGHSIIAGIAVHQ